MSGLNDNVGDHEFRGDFHSDPSNTNTSNITLIETDDAVNTSEIIKNLDSFDVDIVTMNNDVVEITSMNDIYTAITGNTVIAQENIELLETFADGRFKPVVEKIYEEVSPLAGFTKQPTSINFQSVKKILVGDQQEKTIASKRRVKVFVTDRFEEFKKLFLLFTEVVLPKTLAESEAIQIKALEHLKTTANNKRAFLTATAYDPSGNNQNPEEDPSPNFTFLDLRTITTVQFASACFQGYPEKYPSKILFAMLDQAASLSPLQPFLTILKQTGNVVRPTIGDKRSSGMRNMSLAYISRCEGESIDNKGFSYLSLLGLLASGLITIHLENTVAGFEELYRALIESSQAFNPEEETQYDYKESQFIANLLEVKSRLCEHIQLVDQLSNFLAASDAFMDQFKEAEEVWKQQEGK